MGVFNVQRCKNHSMSKYLVVENQQDTNYAIIENLKCAEHFHIDKYGLDVFIKKLNTVTTSDYYILTTGWPMTTIKQNEINIIRSKIIPNDLLIQHVNNFISSLNLEYKKFITIHIRCSDVVFNNNNPKLSLLQKFTDTIINISTTNNCKCLIISNSNIVKQYIKELNLNNTCSKIINAIHLGLPCSDNDVLDTMIDFFIHGTVHRVSTCLQSPTLNRLNTQHTTRVLT